LTVKFLCGGIQSGTAGTDSCSGSLDGTAVKTDEEKVIGSVDVDIDRSGGAAVFDLFGQEIDSVFGGDIVAEHRPTAVTFDTADNDGQTEEVVTGDSTKVWQTAFSLPLPRLTRLNFWVDSTVVQPVKPAAMVAAIAKREIFFIIVVFPLCLFSFYSGNIYLNLPVAAFMALLIPL
jgi:hypothetical protein